MMESEIAWYIGALLMAWAIGWCGGTGHRALQALAERATSG